MKGIYLVLLHLLLGNTSEAVIPGKGRSLAVAAKKPIAEQNALGQKLGRLPFAKRLELMKASQQKAGMQPVNDRKQLHQLNNKYFSLRKGWAQKKRANIKGNGDRPTNKRYKQIPKPTLTKQLNDVLSGSDRANKSNEKNKEPRKRHPFSSGKSLGKSRKAKKIRGNGPVLIEMARDQEDPPTEDINLPDDYPAY